MLSDAECVFTFRVPVFWMKRCSVDFATRSATETIHGSSLRDSKRRDCYEPYGLIGCFLSRYGGCFK